MAKLVKFSGKKLSKKLLMSMPAGVFLASNLMHYPGVSIFGEYIVPLPEREEQWLRIKGKGADQRVCHVFETEKEVCLNLESRTL